MINVCLVICTRARQELLENCLESVKCLQIPKRFSFRVLVVENDISNHCKKIVRQIGDQSGLDIQYIQEPKLGIPFARNAGVEHALLGDLDWIAMIDDDETVSPNWLSAFEYGLQRVPAFAYTGPVNYEYALEPPNWMPLFRRAVNLNLAPMSDAATNNLFLKADIFRDLSREEWFDEAMRFTGGEDTEFTMRVVAMGYNIIWLDGMVVSEFVPGERLSSSSILKRVFREARNLAQIKLKQERMGKKNIFFYRFFYLVINFMKLLIQVFLKFPLAIFHKILYPKRSDLFYRRVNKSVRIAGTIAGFLGLKTEPYKWHF